ncbi:unnamed protein product [Toxocara canis]|uniref:BZIP domain-containing protein n=1 Tax=Toxocara canis TaxID=6265 RepID=A0A183TYS2_TOXCA|nr:unnamed protein product [Toxocara canis]
MQNDFSRQLGDRTSFVLSADDSFTLASAGRPASTVANMKRRLVDREAPIFEATSLALEPTSSPSRLVDDPMFAQIGDPLQVEENLQLSCLPFDEDGQWFTNEPLTSNGEPFCKNVTDFIEVTHSGDYDSLTQKVSPDHKPVTDENVFKNCILTVVPRNDSQPLSPSPIAEIKAEIKSDYGEDSSQDNDRTAYVRKPTSMQSSQLANSFDCTRTVKRGRPMKITSRSKQALYAREYRRKNKQALWNYERRVREQDEEIARLRRQNEQMQLKLAKLTHMKDAIAKHHGPVEGQYPALQVTLAEIVERSSTKQLIGANKNSGFCVHVIGNNYSVLACEKCNAWDGAYDDCMKEEDIIEGLELFNGDFNEIKDFIR